VVLDRFCSVEYQDMLDGTLGGIGFRKANNYQGLAYEEWDNSQISLLELRKRHQRGEIMMQVGEAWTPSTGFMGYQDKMPSSSLNMEYDYIAVSLNDAGCGSQKEILFAKKNPKGRVNGIVTKRVDMRFCEYGGEQLGAGADPTGCFAGETEQAGTYLNPKPTTRTWAIYDLMIDVGLEAGDDTALWSEYRRRHRLHEIGELAWTGEYAWYDVHADGF
jgi:hypothetical protein